MATHSNILAWRIPWASQVALEVMNPPASAGRCKRWGFDPWVGKSPWRRTWQPTPVFFPGESQGPRSLAGGWWATVHGDTESDMTEAT